MATHSSNLAWKIPWTEEPGGLQSMGSQESDMTERLNPTTTTTLRYGGVFIKGTLWKGRQEQHVGWTQKLQ